MKKPAASVRKFRCAVYTRKSSEEGLEMEFNSLDAQRESCGAYIASQRSEGWVELADRYDDRRNRPGRKDQRLLGIASAATDAARAGHRGGDPGRAAGAGDDAAGVDGCVSGGVGSPIAVSDLPGSRRDRPSCPSRECRLLVPVTYRGVVSASCDDRADTRGVAVAIRCYRRTRTAAITSPAAAL